MRIAACSALAVFASTAGPGYCSTNSSYLASGMLIHMEDSDPAVQEAAYSALEALARVKPGEVEAELSKVEARFRCRHYVERLHAACRQEQHTTPFHQ